MWFFELEIRTPVPDVITTGERAPRAEKVVRVTTSVTFSTESALSDRKNFTSPGGCPRIRDLLFEKVGQVEAPFLEKAISDLNG